MTIPLTPETVNLCKEILMGGFKGKYLPFNECFEKSDTVTAKHTLYLNYVEKTGCQIPKVFVYIAMDDILGLCNGKTEKTDDSLRGGDLGYYLKVKEDIKPSN